MPPARHTSAARNERSAAPARRPATPRPREVTSRLPRSKVSWDRKFRVVMVIVFGIAAWMAVKAGMAVMSSHAQAGSEAALVQKYSRENHQLEREAAALKQPATIRLDARKLGMVERGEGSYVITGLGRSGH